MQNLADHTKALFDLLTIHALLKLLELPHGLLDNS